MAIYLCFLFSIYCLGEAVALPIFREYFKALWDQRGMWYIKRRAAGLYTALTACIVKLYFVSTFKTSCSNRWLGTTNIFDGFQDLYTSMCPGATVCVMGILSLSVSLLVCHIRWVLSHHQSHACGSIYSLWLWLEGGVTGLTTTGNIILAWGHGQSMRKHSPSS